MADIVIGYTRDIIPEKLVYTGHETDTAITIVDNNTQEIGVNVKAEVLGDHVVSTDNSISITDKDGKKDLSVNISRQEGNLISHKSDGLYAYIDESKFATEDEANAIRNSINSIKREYATKTWVENKGYATTDDLNSKQDVLTAGKNINIYTDGDQTIIEATTGSDSYNDLTDKPSINGIELIGDVELDIPTKTSELENDSGFATEQWVEDKGYLTEHQPIKTINGQSIVGEGDVEIDTGKVDDVLVDGKSVVVNKIARINTAIGIDFTTDITVGHLQAGTHITADTKIADLLYQMLFKETTSVTLYYNAANDLPNSIDSLIPLEIDRTEIVGKVVTMPQADNQYLIMACDKSVELTNWKTINPDWDLEFGIIPNNDYNIYYINVPDPSIYDDGRITSDAMDYKFIFREAN